MKAAPVRPRRRIAAALVLLCLSGAAFWWLVVQVRGVTVAGQQFTNRERDGVAYLQPLTALTIELAKAGVAAVSGGQADYAPVSAMAGQVQQVEVSVGRRLGTGQRWAELRQRIDAMVGARPAGAAAAASFEEAIGLARALILKVGDTSKLIFDPALDSHYLIDTVVVRLPQVVADVGRSVDEAVFAGKADDGVLAVAVNRFQVAAVAGEVAGGLRKSMEATAREELSRNLAAPVDEFGVAAHAFAPPAVLRPKLSTVDSTALVAAAQQVFKASAVLSQAVLFELDALLADRLSELGAELNRSVLAAAAGVLLLLLLLWWATPVATQQPTAPEDAVEDDTGQAAEALPSVHARDLLEAEELLHLGRGVRGRPQRETGDA